MAEKLMVTAVYLSTNSSKIEVVSSLKQAYSSEGVPTLNMASKVEFPKSLCSTLQSHKVQEAKMADFWPFSRPAHSQKTAHPSRTVYFSVPVQWLCPCHHFVAVAHTRFEVESHKAFPIVLYWRALAEDSKKQEQICLAITVRVRYLHSLQDLLVVFSYL